MARPFVRVNNLREVTPTRPTTVAVGSFDGVHVGHQAVLRKMIERAAAEELRTAVLTFFPHPRQVIEGQTGRYYLTTLDERVELLGGLGVDLVIAHPFDDRVRHTRARDFVSELRQYLDMCQLWGGNFALGYQREGTTAYLQHLGRELDYSVHVVDGMISLDGELVSSSRIRASLAKGDIGDVRRCLDRPYGVSGSVASGERRGHTIGFPTANLDLWPQLLLPADGVYAAYAYVGRARYLAATNIGMRPTVGGRQRTVEAHLLDFDGDLYGQKLRLEFVDRIRPELKFSGLEALSQQIQRDVARTRELLAG